MLTFKKLTPAEVHYLAPLLDSEQQTTQYYDDNKGQVITMQTYTGDWKAVSKNLHKCDSFQVSFIAVEKRS